MYEITNRIIHGSSFLVSLDTVEMLTMRLNEDTNEYWLKLHVPSGKEIRLKVSETDVRYIAEQWSNNENINLNIGEYNGLDNR
ncbi:MAG: hypothetical protein GOVbin1753_77 [Prokaryotic dsDNA virus sp.]|nr:MAG: hypothetical protein GOVbin1753_77 [Prokaryotic dsDNA virus sp.]